MNSQSKRLNPVNIRMSDEMRDKLRQIAAEDGRTISNLVVKVLNDWLEDRRTANRHAE